MKKFTSIMVMCVVMVGIASCAEKSLDKAIKAHDEVLKLEQDAIKKASAVGDDAGVLAHTLALNEERARIAELESKREAARKADSEAWTGGINSAGGLANLLFPGSAAVVAVLGTLITQNLRGKTFKDGEVQGATVATKAITNADVGNVLQNPTTLTAVNAELALAPPHVASAVNAAI